MSFLRIRQIYFEDDQLSKLDYIPFKNTKCDVFFENSVIRSLIESGDHLGADYYGVVSQSLRAKINVTKKWKAVFAKNESVADFSPVLFEAKLYRELPDTMSFTHHPAQDQIKVAEKFHPGFTEIWRKLMNDIGFYWEPEVWKYVTYCNSFVARSEIYEAYVRDMLIPAMERMKQMPELNSPSGYKKPYSESLKIQTGLDHYSWHSFLCERLFSYFVHIRGFKGISY